MGKRPAFKLPREYQAMLVLLGAALVVLWFSTRKRADGDTLLGQFAEDLAKVALVLVAAYALFAAPWWLGGAAAGVVLRTTLAGTALTSLAYQAFGGDDHGEPREDPCTKAGHGRVQLEAAGPGGSTTYVCTDGTVIGG